LASPGVEATVSVVRSIQTTGTDAVHLIESDEADATLDPGHLRGRTIVSLASPGTESQLTRWWPAGSVLGYSCVFEVTECGADVTDFVPGDLVWSFGGHSDTQHHPAGGVFRLPEGLAPEVAVLCRFLGVSWTTLSTTPARPPAPVLVTGLGIVGHFAAQLFAAAGYRVTAVDPDARRRELALAAGLPDVRPEVAPPAFERFADQLSGDYALALECSGHEAAALDAARATRYGGEVVLIGAPWQRRTDLFLHDLLDVVFHHFVTVRSGWEGELPGARRPFDRMSMAEVYPAALEWLRQGRIRTEGLAATARPEDAAEVYAGFSSSPTLSTLFDWRA
jgi:threonine dehydrogenase-like Zn-dependent dehydrogenase